MKIEHINADVLIKIKLPIKKIKNLMDSKNLKKIILTTTTQFVKQLDSMFNQLKLVNINPILFKNRHTRYAGQILGCDVPIIKNNEADSFLYVGDGYFHPNEILLHNNKPVIVYNPFEKSLKILDPKDVNKIKKIKKGFYLSFLSSKNIGVIISVKPGQNFFRASLKLKEKYPNKNFYYLVFNTVEFNQLENFNFIDCFVNTACSRIAVDDISLFKKPVVNLEDLLDNYK